MWFQMHVEEIFKTIINRRRYGIYREMSFLYFKKSYKLMTPGDCGNMYI